MYNYLYQKRCSPKYLSFPIKLWEYINSTLSLLNVREPISPSVQLLSLSTKNVREPYLSIFFRKQYKKKTVSLIIYTFILY